MQKIKSIKQYLSELIKLALPILIGYIGFQFIDAGDVFVAGRYSTDVLAATSIADAIISFIFSCGFGLVISISPVLSNKLGAKGKVKKYFFSTIIYSQIIALIVTLLTFACIPLIQHLGFDEKLIPLIKTYIFIFAFSSFGAYLHMALKEFLQVYEIVFFPNLISILAIFLNLFLNWFFAFNCNMGIAGLALASVLVRVLISIALLIFCLVHFKFKFINIDWKYFGSLLIIGLPISASLLLEAFTFNLIIILMGKVSSVYAAAQSIVVAISGLTLIIPSSIANAISIKVGYANGAKNYIDVKNYSIVGICFSTLFIACCSLLFVFFPEPLARIFTKDLTLINVIVPIIYVVAVFQILDCFQTSICGVLKGLNRTQTVFIAYFIGYILVGNILGSLLAFILNLNLFGFLIGITIATLLIDFILLIEFIRLYLKMKKALA